MRIRFAPTEESFVRARERGMIRSPVFLAIAVLLVTVVALLFWFSNSEQPPSAVMEELPPEVAPETNSSVTPETNDAVTLETDAEVTLAPAPPPVLSPPTRRAQAMVSNLLLLNPNQHEVPPEMVPWWQRRYQSLKESGPDGASAICEFLARNEDMSFESFPQYKQIGFPTLRAALLAALKAIGGPAGIDASREVLRTTAIPAEIAQLVQNLEQSAPKRYRAEYLDAARAVLAQAQTGELQGYDVGSLFQILIRYGGADAVADLKRTRGRWKYYPAIALARLPKGAGVPALIESARAGGNDDVAMWTMVTGHAGKSDEARAALLEAARAGTVPAAAWPELALSLGGYEHHISAPPSSLPPSVSYNKAIRQHLRETEEQFIAVLNLSPLSATEINARLELIDQLSALNPPDAARTILTDGRETLAKELRRKQR